MGTSQVMSVFVNPEKVFTRLQVNTDLDGVQDVMLSALAGAQLHAQTVLDSNLEKKTWDVVYYLDEDAFSGIQPGGLFRLELPSGFVRDDMAFTITSSSVWRMTDPLAVPATDYKVDKQRGLVYLDAETCAEKYVRVVCTTGFNSGNPEDLDETPPEAIPDWLEEAIIAYVGVILDVSQTTNRQGDAKDVYQRAGDHAMVMLSPYIRRKGFTFRPMSL